MSHRQFCGCIQRWHGRLNSSSHRTLGTWVLITVTQSIVANTFWTRGTYSHQNDDSTFPPQSMYDYKKSQINTPTPSSLCKKNILVKWLYQKLQILGDKSGINIFLKDLKVYWNFVLILPTVKILKWINMVGEQLSSGDKPNIHLPTNNGQVESNKSVNQWTKLIAS